MKTHSRHLVLSATAAIAIVAFPAGSYAQQPLEPIKVTESRLRAEQLDREAESYEKSDMAKWRKAAFLRSEAASLRAADDPKGAMSLYWAARDRYYIGEVATGRDLMEQSADRALAIGDVVHAATAYTEAAYIAAELRQFDRAREYAGKAKLLAHSPMLSDDQRARLRSNLGVASLSTGVLAAKDRSNDQR
jgi:hypothetical protein